MAFVELKTYRFLVTTVEGRQHITENSYPVERESEDGFDPLIEEAVTAMHAGFVHVLAGNDKPYVIPWHQVLRIEQC